MHLFQAERRAHGAPAAVVMPPVVSNGTLPPPYSASAPPMLYPSLDSDFMGMEITPLMIEQQRALLPAYSQVK